MIYLIKLYKILCNCISEECLLKTVLFLLIFKHLKDSKNINKLFPLGKRSTSFFIGYKI